MARETAKKPILLASASPRRSELLRQMGLEFEVRPVCGEEIPTRDRPQDIVRELAERKAEAAARQLAAGEEVLIIGADTVVSLADRILGKPADEEEAFSMLSQLSGNTHQVYTGVCLILTGGEGERRRTFYEETEVTFYPMTGDEIREYIRTGEPMDKAGAYGIQGAGGKFIRRINGDYNNVVGLPIARLYHELESFF